MPVFILTTGLSKLVSYRAQRMFLARKIINFAVLHLILHGYKSTGLAQIRRFPPSKLPPIMFGSKAT